jgi:hypothetical protein
MKQIKNFLILALFPMIAISNTIENYKLSEDHIVEGKEFLLNFILPSPQRIDSDISCSLSIDWGDGQKQKVKLGTIDGVTHKAMPSKLLDRQVTVQVPHLYSSSGKKIVSFDSPFFSGCELKLVYDKFSINVISQAEKALIDKKLAEDEQARKIQLEKVYSFKINGVGLGMPENPPCRAKPEEYTFWFSKTPNAIYYSCAVETDTDDFEYRFESDQKSIFTISRLQYFYSFALSKEQVLQKAEAFYGKPEVKTEDKLIYGDGFTYDNNGSTHHKKTGVVMSIQAISCFLNEKNRYCSNKQKPTFVIRYDLTNVEKFAIEEKASVERMKNKAEGSLSF